MRVLHINDYSTQVGGAEHIWRRSHELLLAAGVDSGLLAGDQVVRRRTPWSYVHARAFARVLDEVVADRRPDIVHLHNYYHHCSPAALAVLGRARQRGDVGAVVHTAHDYHLLCPNPSLLRWGSTGGSPVPPSRRLGVAEKVLWRWDEEGWARSELRAAQHVLAYHVRRLQRSIDLVLSPSRFLAEALAPSVPVEVLPNPVPPPDPRHKPAGPVRAVFAGRLVPEKGLVPFLRWAPAELVDGLVVAGTGPEEAAARQAVASRGLGTTFVGQVPRAEVLDLLGRAHVVVTPSRWYENAPTILFEALSRGTGLLGSDLGGVAEIVRDSGVGHLFDPWDVDDVVRAGEAALDDHRRDPVTPVDAAAYLGARTEDRYVERLLARYEALLEGAGRRR